MIDSITPDLSESWASWLYRIAGPMMEVELILAGGMILLALVTPGVGRSLLMRVERGMAAVAQSGVGQIVAVGILALVVRALFLPWLGPPVPISHDEHSLLLQAETYLAGRLVNQTPPFWEYFESIHINLVPAYASMYFPGRGVPLALGLLVADHAWAGVWLSFALMCMAAVWMLQGWVSRPFALLGGVLIVIRLGAFSYWINSYWGGAFTALGAFLVLGAFPRVLREPGWRDGVLLGVGVLIVMTTRPFEGVLVCAPVGIFMIVAMLRSRGYPLGRMILRVGTPLAVLAGCGAFVMLAYNEAATGSMWTSPYDLNRQTYAITPAFLTADRVEGERRGPPYFREFYKSESIPYERRVAPSQVVRGVVAKLYYSWNFYIGFILTPAFLAGLWAARRQYVLPATLVIFGIGYSFETWNFPHYTAPVFPIVLILVMKGFEWLRTWRVRGRESGLFLTRAMPVASLLLLSVPTSTLAFGWPALVSNQHSMPCCTLLRSTIRTEVTARLSKLPGRDLVLVATDDRHPVHTAILYNKPDIDGAEIVWAHRLPSSDDGAFRARYSDRKIWELEWGDGETYHLRPGRPETSGKAR